MLWVFELGGFYSPNLVIENDAERSCGPNRRFNEKEAQEAGRAPLQVGTLSGDEDQIRRTGHGQGR